MAKILDVVSLSELLSMLSEVTHVCHVLCKLVLLLSK